MIKRDMNLTCRFKDIIKKILEIDRLSKEDYVHIKGEVTAQNMKMLEWSSLIFGILMFFLFHATFFRFFTLLKENRCIYMVMFVSSLTIYGICKLFLPKHMRFTIIVFYVFLIMVMLFSIFVGVLTDIDQRASTICVFLLVVPLLVTDKSFRISILLSVSSFCFCVTSYQFKIHNIFVADMVNCICILIIGIIVNITQQRIKFHKFYNQYTIDQANKELIFAQKNAIMLSQIRPHFLYNTLTGIQELCHIDSKLAEQALGELVCYLRGNYAVINNKKIISFELELEHVKHFIYCEKMRFDEMLCVEYDIEATEFSLPPFSLQPLVENSIRHGIGNKEEGGTVKIMSKEAENEWLVTVLDDGIGFSEDYLKETKRKHIGLENVRTRIWDQCGGTLSIQSEKGKGTIVTIHLPKNCTR